MPDRSLFNRIPLAPSLAAASALVILLLTFATVQVIGLTMGQQAKRDIGRNLAELAFQTTDKLDRGMYERYREVKLMAERYEITSAAVPPAAKRAALESMQSTHPYYAWIGLTDNEGNVDIATRGMLEGKNVAARPWFSGAYRGVYMQDVHQAVLLAKLLPATNGEPKRFFDVAFPYRGADGRIAGVLGTHLSWQWAQDVERSVIRPLADRKAVDTFILSKEGIVLLGSKTHADRLPGLESIRRAQRGENAALTETWPDGRTYLVGYSQSRGHASYPGLGWTVVVRQPVDQAFAPVDALRDKIRRIGLGATVVVALLVWLVSRSIIKPLQTITAHADALGAGHARSIPPVRSRLSEVQILQDALNGLLSKLFCNEERLRELNATLETRVTQRTMELHRAVEETRQGERRLRTITDNVPVLIGYVDKTERYRFANATYEAWFGTSASGIVGSTVAEVLGSELYDEHREHLDAVPGTAVRFEMAVPAHDGERIIEVSRIPDIEDGVCNGVYILGADISAARRHENELNELARIDTLTGLPNRRAYQERLDEALQRARRNGTAVALMYLDVDRFKQVNDTLGHAAGDLVLQEFARRVKASVRGTDTVCRLAGDEFTVILEGLKAADEAALVAEKILAAFRRPFALAQGERVVSTSIGVAYADSFPADACALAATADRALYRAKDQGRCCFALEAVAA